MIEVEVLIIGAIIGVLILFIICSIIKTRKKSSKIVLKIEEASTEINNYLNKGINLLEDTVKYITDEDYIENFQKINFKVMSSDEIYQVMKKYNTLLKNKILEDETLNKKDDFFKIADSFRETISYIDGSVKYYSFNVEEYKNIFSKFPAKIIKIFCEYKDFVDYKEEKMGNL